MSLHEKLTVEMKNSTDMKKYPQRDRQSTLICVEQHQSRSLSFAKKDENERGCCWREPETVCVALLLVVSFLSSEYSSYEYSARRHSAVSWVFSQRGTIWFAGNVFLVNAQEFTRILNIVWGRVNWKFDICTPNHCFISCRCIGDNIFLVVSCSFISCSLYLF